MIVNGNPEVAGKPRPASIRPAPVPPHFHGAPPPGTRQLLDKLGPEKFAEWTQVAETAADHRHDLPRRAPVADGHARSHLRLVCHLKFCGAQATQPVQPGNVGRSHVRCLHAVSARRSLDAAAKSCTRPFRTFVSRCCCGPPTQWATRHIPDNVVEAFILEAAAQGIDIFRIFDSLNWLPNMKLSMEAVRKTEQGLRSGHLLHRRHSGSEARQISARSTTSAWPRNWKPWARTFWASRTWRGLCKPYAAERLVTALRQEVAIPIHFHTHDTSGMNAASILKASEAGVHAADAAIASMSGTTSQPNLNSIVAALRHTERDTGTRSRRAECLRGLLGDGAHLVSALRQRASGGHGGSLHSRNARRPVHQPSGAGRIHGAWRALAGDRAHLCGSELCLRRHRQGHALQQSCGRHGHLSGQPRYDREGFGASGAGPQSDVAEFRGGDVCRSAGRAGGRLAAQASSRDPARREAATGTAGRASEPIDLEWTRSAVEKKAGQKISDTDLMSYLMYPDVFLNLPRPARPTETWKFCPRPNFSTVGAGPGNRRRTGSRENAGCEIAHRERAASRWNADHLLRTQWPAARSDCPRPRAEATVQTRPKADPSVPGQVGAPIPGAVPALSWKWARR